MPKRTALAHKLKPGPERRIYRDSEALYVVVQPSGHASWMMRFRGPSGKPSKIVLGPVDLQAEITGQPIISMPLTQRAARQLAAEILRQRALKQDPIADHKAAKQRQRTQIQEAETYAYGTLVRQFCEEHARPRNRKWRYALKLLGLLYPEDGGEAIETKNGLAQRWRDRDVRSIDSSDIFSVVNEARRKGTPGLERRKTGLSEDRGRDLHTALSSLFGWLHRNRFVTVNPCTGVAKPSSGQSRDRVLTNDEIIKFWHACDKIHPTFAAVFRLLLLTGERLNEVAGMRDSELDGEMWGLPGDRTKNKLPHQVPLPPLAMEIIESVPRIENCPYVFTTNGRTPISGWSKIKLALDREMGKLKEPWRLHDLRRTFITHLCELGISPHVVEQLVNHQGGHRGGVAGVYNKSVLMPERTKALLRWAQHIEGLVSGEPTKKVVRLRSR
jgi:integrase